MPRPAGIQHDTWWKECERLELAGWRVIDFPASRYDPTHVEGITPAGRTFVLDMVSADDGSITATLTIAGRTRTEKLAVGSWDGSVSAVLLETAWQRFPVTQR